MSVRSILNGKSKFVQHSTAHKIAAAFGDVTRNGFFSFGLYGLYHIDPRSLGAFARSSRCLSFQSQDEQADNLEVNLRYFGDIERDKISIVRKEFLHNTAAAFNCEATDILDFNPEDEVTITKEILSKFLKSKQTENPNLIANMVRETRLSEENIMYLIEGRHKPFNKGLKQICDYFQCSLIDIMQHGPQYSDGKKRCSAIPKLHAFQSKMLNHTPPQHRHPGCFFA